VETSKLNDQSPTKQDEGVSVEAENYNAIVGQAITTTEENVSAEKNGTESDKHDHDSVVMNNTPTTQDVDTAKGEDNASTQNDDAAAQEKDNAAAKSDRCGKQPKQRRPERKPLRQEKPQPKQPMMEQLQGREPRRIVTTKEQETFFGLCRVLGGASSYQRHIDNIAKATKPQGWCVLVALVLSVNILLTIDSGCTRAC
jgi:hypothetical protein